MPKKLWLQHEEEIEAIFNDHLGEKIRVEPQKLGDFAGPTTDFSRPIYEGSGVLRLIEPYAASVDGTSQRMKYSEAHVDIDISSLTPDHIFTKNDLVTAMDRRNIPQWIISRVELDWHAFIRLVLSPISSKDDLR